MRPEIQNPFPDPEQLDRATELLHTIYCLHEAGQNYSLELSQLSGVVEQPVNRDDILGYFGSMSHDSTAMHLLLPWDSTPLDLSEDELVELLLSYLEDTSADGTLGQFWLNCISRSTRCLDFLERIDPVFTCRESDRASVARQIVRNALKDGPLSVIAL